MPPFVLSIVDFKFTNYKQTRNILSNKRKMSIGFWKKIKSVFSVEKVDGMFYNLNNYEIHQEWRDMSGIFE